ncbi:MAG: transcription/translation regulatory transformer protein RfaH [Thiohalomonadales bacterium]
MRHWYVIQTKPRQERIAQENLDRQGFSCYLPLINEWRKIRGKKILSEVPLFPNYVFSYIDLYLSNCAPIRSTRGVNAMVRFGNEIIAVPDGVIDTMKQYSQTQLAQPELTQYSHGQQVHIDGGPFRGLQAIFIKACGQERALLLLEMLGKKQQIEMPVAMLE